MIAIYNGLVFDTSLLARWAAFFDLAGWSWVRGIEPIGDWKPDYRISIPCTHSECGDEHVVLVSVLKVDDISSVKGHPALEHRYIVKSDRGKGIADAGAVFGVTPEATQWEMSHGSGGGTEHVYDWASDAVDLWLKAGRAVEMHSEAS